jgi:hypothetical protein
MGSKEEREQARRDLEKLRARERAERDKQIQERLDAEARAEQAQRERDAKMDDAFDREAYELLGIEIDEIEEFARRSKTNRIDAVEAQRVIQQAKKQAKGGWFSRGNPRKALKTLKSSKAVRDAAKEAKKEKGCFGCAVVALLTLTGVAGSVTWGVVELVAALTA